MIVFQGRTQVGNLELDDPDKDMISVAVLKDYMQVAGKKIHAGLICDLGNIRIQSGLTLKGMMAGTQFTPEEMQKGGILEYDSRYNPELPTYKEYYSFTTEGRYAFFREE
jgi:hypothetical protein